MDYGNKINMFTSRHLTGLIGGLERGRRAYINNKLGDTGLHGHEFWMLIHLHNYPGVNQDELSRVIGLDKTRIARTCRSLEELGIIERKRDPGNRRQYNVYLTDRGEKLVPRIQKVLNDWSYLIGKDIKSEELRIAIQVLKQMDQNCDALLSSTDT